MHRGVSAAVCETVCSVDQTWVGEWNCSLIAGNSLWGYLRWYNSLFDIVMYSILHISAAALHYCPKYSQFPDFKPKFKNKISSEILKCLKVGAGV